MKTRVIVKVLPVGTCFACKAVVRRVSDSRVVHETRDFPYGFEANAQRSAEEWVEDSGRYEVRADD